MRTLLLAAVTAAAFAVPSPIPAAIAGQEQLGQSNPPPSGSGEGSDCQRKKQEQVTS